MNIGAIGWWNYGNQGDLAMLAALRQGLAPHHIVPIDVGFPAQPDSIYRLNRLDYVLLGGGTLIRKERIAPFDTFDQWAHQLECPLGVVGLGVDPFSDEQWSAVQAMLDRAEFFYVRDRASRTLLRDHPTVQVAPDLTFAHPLPAREIGTDDTLVPTTSACGVNLRGTADFDPAPWLEVLARLPVQLKGVPLISFEEFYESDLLRQLDPESARRFDAAVYRQLDLMIGTAFHSVLFSVQAAVPVIAIDYAPKVRNFMQDSGLERFLLAPDEHEKLPGLVSEILAERSAVAATLRALCARLHLEAQRNVEGVREQIEQHGPRHRRTGPKVTVLVAGSGSVERDQRTLASCAAQTYENTEVLCVSADAPASAEMRLEQAITLVRGEYLTWVDGGDWFADDALDCLVARLEQEDACDVIYGDYYPVKESGLPVGYHSVSKPDKLFRRDIVGPCFLLRKSLLDQVGLPRPNTPLLAYALWLQASSDHKLAPLHAPLFYSARPIRSRAFMEQERQVRRHWRRGWPFWSRIVWRMIDSDLGEKLVVQPAAHLRNRLRRSGRVESN